MPLIVQHRNVYLGLYTRFILALRWPFTMTLHDLFSQGVWEACPYRKGCRWWVVWSVLLVLTHTTKHSHALTTCISGYIYCRHTVQRGKSLLVGIYVHVPTSFPILARFTKKGLQSRSATACLFFPIFGSYLHSKPRDFYCVGQATCIVCNILSLFLRWKCFFIE